VAVGLGSDAEKPPEGWEKDFARDLDMYGENAALGASRRLTDRERQPAEGKQAGILNWIFGGAKETPEGVDPPTVTLQSDPDLHYPTEKDVAKSKEVDQTYGDPVAPYTRAGGATMKHIDIPSMLKIREMGKSISTGSKPRLLSEDDALKVHQSWLAAERSPVSKLGFAPGKTIESFDPRVRLNVAGLYEPGSDTLWYDSTYPSAIVHESIHRGLNQLITAGKIPEGLHGNNEELVVRALMIRHFGDQESKESGVSPQNHYQIRAATELLRDPKYRKTLDDIESAAADMIAERRPKGPR